MLHVKEPYYAECGVSSTVRHHMQEVTGCCVIIRKFVEYTKGSTVAHRAVPSVGLPAQGAVADESSRRRGLDVSRPRHSGLKVINNLCSLISVASFSEYNHGSRFDSYLFLLFLNHLFRSRLFDRPSISSHLFLPTIFPFSFLPALTPASTPG
jgi:hypothetical protein